MPDTAALLRGVPLFNELTEHDLERIARVAVPRSYPAGTVILREGDPGDTCYVLRAGRARVTRQHADGRSDHPHEPRPGRDLRRAGDVRRRGSLRDGRGGRRGARGGDAGRRPEAAAERASRDRREAARRAQRRGCGRPTPASRGSPSRRCRAGWRACWRSWRRPAPARDSNGAVARSDDVVVRSTQADLAQLAGTSREAASRFLATLQRAGVVTCKRGRVIVHDPPALHRYIY